MSIRTRTGALMLAFAAIASAQEPAPPQAPASSPHPSSALMPAEDFFRAPQLADVQLSPSGRQLALLAGVGSARTGLFVFDLTQPTRVARATSFADADVRSFRWVNEQRLVFDLIDRSAGGGDQPFARGLFSVRPDGSELRQLVKLTRPFVVSPVGVARREPLEWNHILLHVPEGDGEEVIVGKLALDGRWDLREIQPLRLNVVDGRAVSLARGMPEATTSWLFDAQGEPRVAVATAQGRVRMMWREPGRDDWQALAEFDSLRTAWTPLFLDRERRLYVRRVASDGFGVLARFDAASRKPLDEAFVRTPGFDFSGSLVTSRGDGRLLGVHVTTDAATTVWLDDEMKRLQALADARLPGRINRLSCRRCAEADQVVLVHSWSDRDPGQYQVYEAATRKWTVVGRAQPQIDAARMARVGFERISARDGRGLPLWLTLPPGLRAGDKPAQPLPAVVLVHGGPWVRGGHWAWEPMAQFLASRGLLVIQPEFRGSTGYGAAHFRAGWRQWGRAMQDDIADALQWTVKQGLADPKRACIAGASWGGYAALMGLVRDPQLYRCAVAWVAVTDVPLLFESNWRSDLGDEARHWTLPTLIGDPRADAELLRDVSPLTHAARIKQPVLLAFGAEDRRVPIEHGQKMRDALRAAGHEPQWVVYPGEGHGWLRFDHRVDFARRVETFLADHLALHKP